MHMSTDITCPFNKVLCTPMLFRETNNVYLALEYPIGEFFSQSIAQVGECFRNTLLCSQENLHFFEWLKNTGKVFRVY